MYQVISARELYKFLVVKAKGRQKGEMFQHWIKRILAYMEAIENKDYKVLEFGCLGDPIDKLLELYNQQITVHKRKYTLATDIAKEISVIQNNHKDKQAKRYFIDC